MLLYPAVCLGPQLGRGVDPLADLPVLVVAGPANYGDDEYHDNDGYDDTDDDDDGTDLVTRHCWWTDTTTSAPVSSSSFSFLRPTALKWLSMAAVRLGPHWSSIRTTPIEHK